MAETSIKSVTAFSDIGDYYLGGKHLGEVCDCDVIRNRKGVHITTSTKGCLCTFSIQSWKALHNAL